MTFATRIAASRREWSAARQIPYASHVTDSLVRTYAGDFVQVFSIAGASFESADDDELNNWHERLNVTWRNIASPNVALWAHIFRRRERALPMAEGPEGFAGMLARKYRDRLAGETLMVNELYLAIVELLRKFDEGSSVAELAKAHERTPAGIHARLVRHGRLEGAGPESRGRAATAAVGPIRSEQPEA